MPGRKDHDFAAADILADVLGSQRAALYGLVPAGRALVSQFVYLPKPDVGYAVAAGGFPKGGDAAPLLADMRGVIADTLRDGVSPELVEAARRQELAQLAFANDSISGLAESWSRALAFQGMQSPADLARAYTAVTVEDVNRLAPPVADAGPRGDRHPDAGECRAADRRQWFRRRGIVWCAAGKNPSLCRPGAAAALDTLQLPPPPVAPVASVLPNGLRLIVLPEHVGHTISVFGRVRQDTDMQEAPGHEGVAQVAGELFNYGTQSLDRLQFQEGARRYRRDRGCGRQFFAEGSGAAVRGRHAVAGG